MPNIWEEKRQQLRKLHDELELKPETEKLAFHIHPGSILNAYREADVSFDQALNALKMYYETTTYRLSVDAFYHLKSLINAFDIADERDTKAVKLLVEGIGEISWAGHGKEILIDLEKAVETGEPHE